MAVLPTVVQGVVHLSICTADGTPVTEHLLSNVSQLDDHAAEQWLSIGETLARPRKPKPR